MARNGSGTYSLPAGNPVVTGTSISSTWANTTLSDIATAMTQSLSQDGQTPVTANLPMGGFKLTGLAAGSGAGDSVRYEQFASPPAIGGTAAAAGSFTTLAASSTLAVTGAATFATTAAITGNFTVNNKFSVTAASGNTTVAGTLAVTNAITATGGVVGNVTGNVTGDVTGNVSGSSGSCTGNSATATFSTSAGGSIYQVVQTTSSVASTGTTALPIDNTIPQNTEGDQFLSVSITPISATSKLIIDVSVQACQSGGSLGIALFKDAAADAIAASLYFSISTTSPSNFRLSHEMTSGGTSAITFNVRMGSSGPSTTYFNRSDGGGQFFGGAMVSYIRVYEVRP